MRDLLLIGIVVPLALIATRQPVVGMIAYVGISLLNPHSMTWSIARHMPFAQWLAIGTLVGFVLWNEPKRVPMHRETYMLLGVWLLFGITSLFADFPDRANEKFVDVSKVFLMATLSMAIINNLSRLHMLLRVIALSLGFFGLKGGVFFVLTGGSYMIWGPEQSFLAANNSIGLGLAMNIPLLFYLSQVEKVRWLKRLMQAMALFSCPAVVGTYSRGAWLGLATAVILIVLGSRHRIVFIIGLVAILAAALPLMPQRATDRYQDLVNYEEEASAQSRFASWEFATHVALANPILGAGFNYYGFEAYEKYFPEFLERYPGKYWSCHSTWLTVLSEHGFPTFLLWVGLLISAMASLVRLARAPPRSDGSALIPHFSRMMLAVLITYAVPGTFIDAAYFDIFWQLLAVVVMLKEIAGRAVARVPSTPRGEARSVVTQTTPA